MAHELNSLILGMKVSTLKVYESVSSNTSVAVLRTIKLKLWIEKELSHLDPET